MNEYPSHTHEAVALLSRLITIPGISRAEKEAADALQAYLEKCSLAPRRVANNVWCTDPLYDKSRPTVLLNAHIDTVKPAASWTKKPFEATLEDGKLYGLGSNDCGGGLVSLLQAYRIMLDKPRCYNLIYLASAEEEVSGAGGISSVLPMLPPVTVAIVGEPTGMQPAIAERGLDFDYFYACGPLPMLHALYNATECDGQLSFEERMGCGFGACMGCSCKTKYGNERSCKDGPVLVKEEIVW